MKKYLYIVAALFLLTACEYEFDVTSPVGETRMFVESISGITGAKSYINVKKAVPVGQDKSKGTEYSLESFTLTQDGKELALTKEGTEGTFSFVPEAIPGSRLELRLKARGIEEIRASSLMPAPIELEEVKCERMEDRLYWDLSFKSEAQNLLLFIDDYYFHWFNIYSIAENSMLEALSSQLKTVNWLVEIPSEANETESTTVLNYSYVMIDKKSIQENSHLVFGSFATTGKIRLHLISLSDEAYGYLNAKYNRDNNFMALLGLSPPNFAYSNVENGFGVFSATTESVIEITIE